MCLPTAIALLPVVMLFTELLLLAGSCQPVVILPLVGGEGRGKSELKWAISKVLPPNLGLEAAAQRWQLVGSCPVLTKADRLSVSVLHFLYEAHSTAIRILASRGPSPPLPPNLLPPACCATIFRCLTVLTTTIRSFPLVCDNYFAESHDVLRSFR